jgi:hypothetical protein
LLGNGSTNPANNFVGTTDSQPLVIKTDGTERLRVNVPTQVSGGTSETLAVSGSSIIGRAEPSSAASGYAIVLDEGSGSVGCVPSAHPILGRRHHLHLLPP